VETGGGEKTRISMGAIMSRSILSTRIASSFARSAFATATFVLALGLTPAAAGADPDEALSRTVQFADLNLDRPEGVERLYGRIRGAAKAVCSPAEGKSLKERAIWRACFEQAVGNAVAEIDLPSLTAYHIARTGKTGEPAKLGQRD
jgi:UrcA family protein